MKTLTIGMPTFNDYNGVYFTVQALRMYHDMHNVEILVVDNFGCKSTEAFVKNWARCKYVRHSEADNAKVGTAIAKDQVFEHASGDFVLCIDCHVLLLPGVVDRLKQLIQEGHTSNLYHGPLIYDDLISKSTHMDPVWRSQMWGVWARDSRGDSPDAPPFDIWGHGMGLFGCWKDAWPGFNKKMLGFGGEEGYIQEKVRKLGGKVLCVPWLQWMHRFGHTDKKGREVTNYDKFRNYLLGHVELGLELEPMFLHFLECYKPADLCRIASEILNKDVSIDYKLIIKDKVAVEEPKDGRTVQIRPSEDVYLSKLRQSGIPARSNGDLTVKHERKSLRI